MSDSKVASLAAFSFATATQIVFGSGTLAKLPELIKAAGGTKALVVTGKNAARAKPVTSVLDTLGLPFSVHTVDGEPTTHSVSAALAAADAAEVNIVIGIGGGSALDSGKAIAALLANGGQPLDYLEVIGAGRKLTKPSLPFIAIPTTSGTGAEVTKNAVLLSPEHNVKVSLRSDYMLPTVALVDPQLTLTSPADVTISCGLDAFTQCLEPFVSCMANPLTDAFCREGLKHIAKSLRTVVEDGTNLAAREDMALGSLMGGLALANAKLGAVHGFAGPLGGMYPSGPHGGLCASTLPACIRVNIAALRARAPDNPALDKFREAAAIVTGNPAATADDGAAWVEDLVRALRVPGLATYGVTEDAFDAIVTAAAKASSMGGNPIKLTPEELRHILTSSM